MTNVVTILISFAKNARTDVAMTSPTTTTLPLPSNEGCGHFMSTFKSLWQEWGGRKAWRQENARGCGMMIPLAVRADYVDSLCATDEAGLLAP
jgi:hypothetical protein